MASLGIGYHRGDIIAKDERIVVWTVKQEIELMFGMCFRDSTKVFVRKMSDAFKSVFQEQSCVDGYFHANSLLLSDLCRKILFFVAAGAVGVIVL